MEQLTTPLLVLALVTVVGLPLAWFGTRLARPRRQVGSENQGLRQPIVVGPAVPIVVGPTPAVVIGPHRTASADMVPSVRPGPALRGPFRSGPEAGAIVQVGPRTPQRIAPPARSFWDERGWTCRPQNGSMVYEGHYRVLDRRLGQPQHFAGRVVVRHGSIVPYIADPPAAIRHHPKGPCFSRAEAPWFHLHWRRPAQNVDDTILYMEKILDEALGSG